MPTQRDLNWAMQTARKLMEYAKRDPRILGTLFDQAMYSEGFRREARKALGHAPIEDPQANWEKLMYTPTKFKQTKDKTTHEMRDLTPEEKKQKIWRSIRLKNILGDLLGAVGAVGGTVTGMQAGQMEAAARNSATRRQKDIYGATMADRAAAASVPMLQGLSALLPTLSGLAANRFYQEAGDQRSAYLTALSDATFNNVNPPATYMHERRLIGKEE